MSAQTETFDFDGVDWDTVAQGGETLEDLEREMRQQGHDPYGSHLD